MKPQTHTEVKYETGMMLSRRKPKTFIEVPQSHCVRYEFHMKSAGIKPKASVWAASVYPSVIW
jgi:hypothetical protein